MEKLPVSNQPTPQPISEFAPVAAPPPLSPPSMVTALIIFGLAISAGVATGFGGYKLNQKNVGGNSENEPTPLAQIATDNVKAGDVFGIKDEATFKDSAEGYLEAGGIGDEGSHKLLREGGMNQTVVLTSSVTDLDKFVGMRIKVWGETFKGQKAGWLMDVGRVQVDDPKAEPPFDPAAE